MVQSDIDERELMLTTTTPGIVEFWRERGYEAKEMYTADNITRWKIYTPEEHADLRHPAYISMLVEERAQDALIVSMRFSGSVFTPKVGEHLAHTVESDGQPALVFSKDLGLLKYALTNPSDNACPDIACLMTHEVVEALQAAIKEGVELVNYVVSKKNMETIPAKGLLHILELERKRASCPT